MQTSTERTELSPRILQALIELGRGIKASELAECLQVPLRDVVGRLQALKRRGLVTHERNSEAPGAAGLWAVSEEGQQVATAVLG
jgi:DNA-binding MarR family transcriptional regulator